jgi:hypothetical protein
LATVRRTNLRHSLKLANACEPLAEAEIFALES